MRPVAAREEVYGRSILTYRCSIDEPARRRLRHTSHTREGPIVSRPSKLELPVRGGPVAATRLRPPVSARSTMRRRRPNGSTLALPWPLRSSAMMSRPSTDARPPAWAELSQRPPSSPAPESRQRVLATARGTSRRCAAVARRAARETVVTARQLVSFVTVHKCWSCIDFDWMKEENMFERLWRVTPACSLLVAAVLLTRFLLTRSIRFDLGSNASSGGRWTIIRARLPARLGSGGRARAYS